jgi:hypothetical protein
MTMIKFINMKGKVKMLYNWLVKTFNWSYILDTLFNAFLIVFWCVIFIVLWGIIP